MKYLLDTNTCIRYINGRAPQIRERIRLIADTDITISTVTMGEMFFGQQKVSILNVPAPDRMLFSFVLPISFLMKPPPTSLDEFALIWKQQVHQLAPTICKSPRLRWYTG